MVEILMGDFIAVRFKKQDKQRNFPWMRLCLLACNSHKHLLCNIKTDSYLTWMNTLSTEGRVIYQSYLSIIYFLTKTH